MCSWPTRAPYATTRTSRWPSPPQYPQGLEAFVSQVVPILQERGLFRTEYTGTTLRDHYGLPRPESQYARELAAAGV